MNELTSHLFGLFARFGYGAVFAGVLLDNAGLPLAGELTLLISGSLVGDGNFTWMPTVLIAAAAAFASDCFWYGVGRLGSGRLIGLYCRVSFGSAACMSRTQQMLTRFGPRGLLVARFVPGFRTFAAPMAGMAGLALRRFAFYDGLGALLWASVGVSTGMLFAREIPLLINRAEQARNGLLLFGAALLGIFILMKLWIRLLHGRAEIPANPPKKNA